MVAPMKQGRHLDKKEESRVPYTVVNTSLMGYRALPGGSCSIYRQKGEETVSHQKGIVATNYGPNPGKS